MPIEVKCDSCQKTIEYDDKKTEGAGTVFVKIQPDNDHAMPDAEGRAFSCGNEKCTLEAAQVGFARACTDLTKTLARWREEEKKEAAQKEEDNARG